MITLLESISPERQRVLTEPKIEITLKHFYILPMVEDYMKLKLDISGCT